jgi:3-oxoacyl-(acyl-carrier-protein) synthase
MIIGMGAAALVVESQDAAQERGVRAIGEILATCIANSAYHGTRLDMQHISEVMDRLLSTAENRFGIRREKIASQLMFMSHETYTPARERQCQFGNSCVAILLWRSGKSHYHR